eukprot:CAMPEP_0194174152 /NCGR_PEP_ID=MMETSP0154-20130528/8403_1 /TAXON_ID=1049557 /ORGANISM="Thalassiothrix antarctica, Strain L6-D1" /LENGTH=143 /DNA_ID=CAMNT_0038887499 /DNA_START=148 /DNA_END=576 /DNA_ORIENTATION=+
MTRKSKKSSGHTPLTYYEMHTKFKSAQYGTTTQRLSTDSQLPFGCCALSLSPADEIDPVATPSGHIYDRESILTYLVTKTAELKQQHIEYMSQRKREAERTSKQKKEQQSDALVVFENLHKASSASAAIQKKRKTSEHEDKEA